MSDGGFLLAVAAKVTASLLTALPRGLRKALSSPDRQAALETCFAAGFTALLASAEDKQKRDHIESVLQQFFADDEVTRDFAKENERLLANERLRIPEIVDLFNEAGFDSDTLEGIDLGRGLEKFEQAFVQTVLQQPCLQGEIQTGQSLVQTRLLREMRDDLRRLAERGPLDEIALALLREPVKPTPPLRRRYLEGLMVELGRLPLAGIGATEAALEGGPDVGLAGVYTSLATHSLEAGEEDARALDPSSRLERRRLSALEMLVQEPLLVLLGEPGSGKTTFVHFVALCMAGELLGSSDVNLSHLNAPPPGAARRPKKDGASEPITWSQAPLLPLRVVLKDFATRGLPDALEEVDRNTLWRFIVSSLGDSLAELEEVLKEELHTHGGLLLLDGLDEVPQAETRRKLICAAVHEFRKAFPACRILATCRTYAYQKQEWKLSDFAEAVLAPFDDAQVNRFIERWYAQVGPLRDLTRETATEQAELLKVEIHASPSTRELAERPLLLTLMALLRTYGGSTGLPEKREKLYAAAVVVLLDLWESAKVRKVSKDRLEVERPSLAQYLQVGREVVRRALEELAYEVHADSPDPRQTADIPEERLVNKLISVANTDDVKHLMLARYLGERSGLLAARGDKVYAFPHRTLQEYMAACHLGDHPEYPDLVARLAREEPERWREVVLLAGAFAADRNDAPLWSLVDELCPAKKRGNATQEAWGTRLAAEAILESARLERDEETGALLSRRAANQDSLDRVRHRLAEVLTGAELPASERAGAGRALARLGDVRPEVLTVESMEFCFVPAGPFLWQGKEERPLGHSYWISRFPITQAQYRQFCEAGGYREPRYWREAESAGVWKEGEVTDWFGQSSANGPWSYGEVFSSANHPVVGVTWYEALAFTRWFTERLPSLGLPAGWRVGLPSEAEWEKAARGGLRIPAEVERQRRPLSTLTERDLSPNLTGMENDVPARTYPWGNEISIERANFDDSGIGATSAVGAFPLGRSPYGCEEMSGNVWEWCRDVRHGDPARDKDADVALRGGAWLNEASLLAAAYRYRVRARIRLQLIGFRCVLVSSSEHD